MVSINSLAKTQLFSNSFIIKNLYKFSFIGVINIVKYQSLSINTINNIMHFVLKSRKIKRFSIIKLLENIISNQQVDDDFLHNYKKYLNWKTVCRHQDLSKNIIFIYFNKFEIRDLLIFQNVPKEILEDNIHLMDMEMVSEYQILDESFIEKFENKINFKKIGENNQFSDKFILKYKHKLDIKLFCRTQNLNDHVIKDLISNNLEVCFETISWRQDLGQDFIKEYFMFLDKDDIVSYQNITESFMEEFWEYLNHELISYHQKISYNFFRLHKNDLYPSIILKQTIKNGHKVLAISLLNIFNCDILQLLESYL